MARRDRVVEAVEVELVETLRLLWRMPDKERAFLSAGSRSSMPEIIKDVQTDYADDAEPREPLGRAQVERMARVWLHPGCLVERVRLRDRKLVAAVLAAKAGRMPGGFRWEDVWQRLNGMLERVPGVPVKVTSDAMRARYEDALRQLSTGVDSLAA